jgi:transcriptional regulator with XRE-family HTH domain
MRFRGHLRLRRKELPRRMRAGAQSAPCCRPRQPSRDPPMPFGPTRDETMPKRNRPSVVVKRRTPKEKDPPRSTLTARLLLTHNVRSLLAERGLNQTELARRLGRSQPYISQILNGRRGIAIEALDDLADTLGVSVEHLFLDPLRAPARHVVAEEIAVLDALRTAPGDTREAIRLMLHLPKDSLVAAADAQSATIPRDRNTLVALLADALEAARYDPAPALADIRRDRTARST